MKCIARCSTLLATSVLAFGGFAGLAGCESEEVVDVTPTEKVMYAPDHPDFAGGDLGSCNPGA